MKEYGKMIKTSNLIGNKCDLFDNDKNASQEYEKFASDNQMKFFKTSAKNKMNIKDSIDQIVLETYQKIQLDESQTKLKNNFKTPSNNRESFKLNSPIKSTDIHPSNCC